MSASLGFGLLRQGLALTPENVVISPFSIAQALSLLRTGATAASETEAELNTLLGFSKGLTTEGLAEALAPIKKLLADNTEILSSANGVWGNKLRDSFRNNVASFLNASAHLMPEDKNVRDEINQFVSDATKGLIKDLLSEEPRHSGAVLVNAVYFSGNWTFPFTHTEKKDFFGHNSASSSSPQATGTVPMMRLNGKFFQYFEDDKVQVVALPYKNTTISAIVVLPSLSSSLDNLVSNLTPQLWNEWTNGNLTQVMVNLELPRFQLEYGGSIKDQLASLGATLSMSSDGEYCPMSEDPLIVQDVITKAKIDVFETGTVAAAATAIMMMRAMMPMNPPKEMICNRPFLFAITDTASQQLLFVAAVRSL